MFKRIAMSVLALTTMLIGPAQSAVAQQECVNLYLTHMYSDATYTTEVGFISGVCSYPYPRYTLFGTYTYYQIDELQGSCGCGPIE